MASEDYYALLGVDRQATSEELNQAYRRLARELHPDTNPDPAASDRFKQINLAYQTLRDPEKRRRYDAYGAEGPAAAGGGDPFGGFGQGGFGDLFDTLFGQAGGFGSAGSARGPRRGEDAQAILNVEFSEAVFGAERELSVKLPVMCSTCSGSGAKPGTQPMTCSTCSGSGEIRRVRQSILGQVVTANPCPNCGGTGEQVTSPCPDCRGDGRRTEEMSFIVDVPAGVDQGQTLRLTGRGAGGMKGGPPGDLYVQIRVKPHPSLTRAGSDLLGEAKISIFQAALGVHLPFQTLEETEELAIPGGTQSGRQIRLRGKGVPHLQARGRGDLIVSVKVETPGDLSKEHEDLLRQVAAARGEDVADPDSGLMSKIRGAFK